MADDARERHEVHDELVGKVGARTAAFLMERLPPTNWGELVTKDYLREQLDAFEHRLNAEFERRLNDAMTSQTRTIIGGQVGAVVATAVAIIAAVQLT